MKLEIVLKNDCWCVMRGGRKGECIKTFDTNVSYPTAVEWIEAYTIGYDQAALEAAQEAAGEDI